MRGRHSGLGPVLSLMLLLGVGTTGPRASAQSIHAAALPPVLKPVGTASELRNKLLEAIVQGLGTLSGPSGPSGELGDVMSATETRAKLGDELPACNDVECLPRATAVLGVNRLFVTDLTVAGKNYIISMRLYDGAAHELTHAQEQCEICTVREAEDALTKTAARLAAAARTFPLAAVASVSRGPTGPDTVREPSEAPPPSPMQPAPPPPAASVTRSTAPWRALGFGAVGVAVVGLAVGIPLLVIDGHPTCNAADPTHECARLYHTKAGGAVMTAIGVVGIVASVPLFYFDYRDRHRSLASLGLKVATTSNGSSLVLGGSF